MGQFEKFSEAEIAAIQNAFWPVALFRKLGEGTIHCPSCGSDCHVLASRSTGYPKSLTATCHVCGKSSHFRSAEERGPDFSEYDREYFVVRHQGGLESTCRHCHTPIDIEENPAIGGALFYTLRCNRCGSFGRHHWR